MNPKFIRAGKPVEKILGYRESIGELSERPLAKDFHEEFAMQTNKKRRRNSTSRVSTLWFGPLSEDYLKCIETPL